MTTYLQPINRWDQKIEILHSCVSALRKKEMWKFSRDQDLHEESRGHNQFIINLLFQPLKCPKHMNSLSTSCYCIAGKVEMLMWMGMFNDVNLFKNCLPKGFKVKIRENEMCIKSNTSVSCFSNIMDSKLSQIYRRYNFEVLPTRKSVDSGNQSS